MNKMNIPLMATLLALSVIVCPILYFTVGPELDGAQLEVLRTLGIIAACSAAFCFVVGEATGNNSQMDKLWSLLPVAYTWVTAAKGEVPIGSSFGRGQRTTAGLSSVLVLPSGNDGRGCCSTSDSSLSTRTRWC